MIKRIKKVCMFFNPNRGVNPLKTDVESAVDEMSDILFRNPAHQIEITKSVINRVMPEYCIGHRPYQVNPHKREKVIESKNNISAEEYDKIDHEDTAA